MLEMFFSTTIDNYFYQVLYDVLNCLPRDTEIIYLTAYTLHFWQGRASIDS